MTRPKAQALGALGARALSGWTSDLVPQPPDLRDALDGTTIDAAAFAHSIVEPLAYYRMSAEARAKMGQKAAIVAWLREAEENLEAALADGRLSNLPAFFAEPAVEYAALKAGTTWQSVLASGDIGQVGRFLREGREALGRQRSVRGRPSAFARDRFLQSVLSRLREMGLDTHEAQHRADLVLVRCGVPSPEYSVARAARRATRRS